MKFNPFLVTITGKEKGSGAPPLSSILFFLYYKFPKKEKGKVGRRKKGGSREKKIFLFLEKKAKRN